MPKTTSTPKSRGVFNADFIDELAKTDLVIAGFRNPSYNAALVEGEIEPSFVDALETDVLRARSYLQGALSGRTSRKDATVEQSAERDELIAQIQVIQSRVLQKYHADNPNRANDYYVGTKLGNASKALLRQIADGILVNLETDTLPGINAQTVQNLRDALAAWEAKGEQQSESGGSAITKLADFKVLYKDILLRRATIQYAADAAFSYRETHNHAAREAFGLPVDQPFRAPKR